MVVGLSGGILGSDSCNYRGDALLFQKEELALNIFFGERYEPFTFYFSSCDFFYYSSDRRDSFSAHGS